MKKRNESSLVTALLVYLQTCENLGKIAHVDRLNSGSFKVGNHFVRGHRPGTWDICIRLNDGRTVWVEAKMPGEEISTKGDNSQAAFMKKMSKIGDFFYVAYSVDDLVRYVAMDKLF